MYSYRWAKFLIAGARYNDSQVLLVELYIHRESDGIIKPGVCRNRQWVLSHLVNGSTLFTLNQNNNNPKVIERNNSNDIGYHFTQGCMI